MLTGQCTNVFTEHFTPVRWAQFYANDRRIISAGQEVRVWDVATNQCVRVLHGHAGPVRTCTVSRTEALLLSLSEDHTAKVWELATGTCMQTFYDHHDVVEGSCFVRNDTWVASIGRYGSLCIWRISAARCAQRFANYSDSLSLHNSYRLNSRDKEYIIVSPRSSPYEVHVLAVESGGNILTFAGHTHRINAVSVSADGKYLISANNGGTMRIFVFSENEEFQYM